MYVLKAGKVCQKRAESVNEKPAISRLFNARLKFILTSKPFTTCCMKDFVEVAALVAEYLVSLNRLFGC